MASPTESPTEDLAYVRGVRVDSTDTRRVVRVLVAVVLVSLTVLTAALLVVTAKDNSGSSELRHQGVPVAMTVSSCEGVGSGIGDGIQYWVCRGTYSLGGSVYNEVIRGSRAYLPDGEQIDAVAVPGKPSLVAIAASLKGHRSSWTAFVTPMILGGVVLTSLVAIALWQRRSARKATT